MCQDSLPTEIFGQLYLIYAFILTEHESHHFHGHFLKLYECVCVFVYI